MVGNVTRTNQIMMLVVFKYKYSGLGPFHCVDSEKKIDKYKESICSYLGYLYVFPVL